MAAKKYSGKLINKKAKADPVGNASEKRCETGSGSKTRAEYKKQNHYSAQEIVPAVFNEAVIDQADPNGYTSEDHWLLIDGKNGYIYL